MENRITLTELNAMVRQLIDRSMATYWVVAEIGDMNVNNFSHHCYMELVERDPSGRGYRAKARATMWAAQWGPSSAHFEQMTGVRLTPGMSVLMQVRATFHEVYGFSYSVLRIDPAYTLGDQQRQRRETIERLTRDGVIGMNKELSLPFFVHRIAVVSSPTAAGYGDFVTHLGESRWGARFAVHLFPALMQGEGAVGSIIAALDRVAEHMDLFDVVLIARGGGGTSDLVLFDNYDLAYYISQFSLPVIAAIGHERDTSVVDMVAHTRAKTPTAAAAMFVEAAEALTYQWEQASQQITSGVAERLAAWQLQLQQQQLDLARGAAQLPERMGAELQLCAQRIGLYIDRLASQQMSLVEQYAAQLPLLVQNSFAERQRLLEHLEHAIALASPQRILEQGYALVTDERGVVHRADQLAEDQLVTLRFEDGVRRARITHNTDKN